MPTLKMHSPNAGFTFGFDPEARALFLLAPYTPGINEQIGSNIATPEQAQFAVQMWCAGYKTRAREIVKRPGAKHHHLYAESGKVGARMQNLGHAQPFDKAKANG